MSEQEGNYFYSAMVGFEPAPSASLVQCWETWKLRDRFKSHRRQATECYYLSDSQGLFIWYPVPRATLDETNLPLIVQYF